ncbi:MAG: DUF2357 domain-containing protein [Bacilli bacterium]|nr:DUF2357 domain-containing protein [Bacilli bacterium]
MVKKICLSVDKETKDQTDNFNRHNKSKLDYESSYNGNLNSLEWLEIIEEVVPYLDNIVRAPKVSLVGETEVRKIEKAKKTSVDTVKDLSKHTDYIDKVDPKTGDVLPSKLLVSFREDTFNTYENRFIYTLILNLLRFITEKEEELKSYKPKTNKELSYTATTSNGKEKVEINLSINTRPTGKPGGSSDIDKTLSNIKKRMAKIKKFINAWLASELIVSLEKQHAILVMPPVKKTNLILKNPNFKMATKLWDFLYSVNEQKNKKSSGLSSKGDDLLKYVLDSSFLMDYYVLDAISVDKNEQKDKLCKYALLIIMNQVQTAVNILLENGIKISEEELLRLLSTELTKKKNVNQIGSSDIKKKFQKEMDDYLSRTTKYL